MTNLKKREKNLNNSLLIVGIREFARTYTIIGTTVEPLQTVGSGIG
jgi:hypothetical protein